VLVKGGHLEGDRAADLLVHAGGEEWLDDERLDTPNTHGTGCTFSSAIASNLAHGRQLSDAVVLAKAFVTEAIRKAYAVGPGRLPLNHLHRMQHNPRPIDLSPPAQEPEPAP